MSTNNNTPFLEKGIVLNGKWEILEHIATGGKGEVYRARQVNLERGVAVKIISERFLSSHEGDAEEIQTEMDRFRREVLAMAQMRHPIILQVYDQDRAIIRKNDEEVSIDYLVMEYIPGPTLRTTMPPEGLRKDEREIRKWIRNYFLPLLDGAEKLHELDIVHRDLKPENVLLDELTPKITDFGLAGGPRWQQHVTRSHHMDGTIPYMSREQIEDMAETDFRGDIYALGKILYECVIGKMGKDTTFPFKTARLLNPDTPFLKQLDRIIQQATAEDKGKRTSSVKMFRNALLDLLAEFEEAIPQLKRRALRKAYLVLGVVVVIVAASIGFHILYHREKSSHADIPLRASVPVSTQDLTQIKESISSAIDVETPLPASQLGKEGVKLLLVPRGGLNLPESFGATAGRHEVASFYIDETEVANDQYVGFLNKNLSRIHVERGIVHGDGDIWILLGEVMKGHEPIVFHNGEFFVTNSQYGSYPVVRVTPHGADAYARFYGRRLPNEIEWLYAMREGGPTSDAVPVSEPEPQDMMGHMNEMMTHMEGSQSKPNKPSPKPKSHSEGISSVFSVRSNRYGIRGLDGNVSEWGFRVQETSRQGEKKATEYVVLGGSKKDSGKERQLVPGIKRFPWEAFKEVGFRCVLKIQSRDG